MLGYYDIRWEAARKRRKALLWCLAALFVFAVAAVEIISFARLYQVTSAPPLTIQQKLALAKANVTFSIRQPTWLPSGITLCNLDYYSEASNASVTLMYGQAYVPPNEVRGASFMLLESTRPWVIVGSPTYQDTQGRTHPMIHTPSNITIRGVSILIDTYTGGGQTTQPTLSWRNGDIYYYLEFNDNLPMLEHVAASLIGQYLT